jgi:2-polyprenyl-3-methyl-5-hydroxy-6-metoxy-1,4-benzoquinol methylase
MPSDVDDAIQRSWIANATAWTAAVRSGAIASRRLATDAAIVEAVLARQPRRVLDVGCGEGWLSRALAGRGVDVTGIDSSAALIDAARQRGGGTFAVLAYDALAEDGTRAGVGFDVIVANFALLGENIVPLLHGLRAAVAPYGALIIQTVHPAGAGGPYRNGWRTEDFRGFPSEHGTWQAMPWFFRTLGSWTAALRDAGYVVAEIGEPVHPETATPLSLLMMAEVRPER